MADDDSFLIINVIHESFVPPDMDADMMGSFDHHHIFLWEIEKVQRTGIYDLITSQHKEFLKSKKQTAVSVWI
jgi:hypothetical protein